MNQPELYIGLMSGTSVDGIDVALVNFSSGQAELIDYQTIDYPKGIQARIHRLCHAGDNEVVACGQTDRALGHIFSHAVITILDKNQLSPDDIVAIGSHGQTVRHYPSGDTGFTLQLGDPNTISTTGIDVVADFRKKDVALGGQGAPLVPAFHHAMFAHPRQARVILNIGGISNITFLPSDKNHIQGWDIGPGNTLMDAWCRKHKQQPIDWDGAWADQAEADESLLHQLLSDPYFTQSAPKSTGREHFNLSWLEQQLTRHGKILSTTQVQATLLALTVQSIVKDVRRLGHVDAVYVCGGGSHNSALMKRLTEALPEMTVTTTAEQGISPDCVESMAFAWLAYAYKHSIHGNVPAVTGASRSAVLGALYPRG